jgi:hypothetical protein
MTLKEAAIVIVASGALKFCMTRVGEEDMVLVSYLLVAQWEHFMV